MEKVVYTRQHLWIKIQDNICEIGLTDYAQSELGAIMFVNLPNVDDEVRINEQMGDVESIKTVSELLSPVSGNVVEKNELTESNPNVINEKPYETWLVRVKYKSIGEFFMTEDEYKSYMESL